jgi:fructokinase
MIRIGVDFGGSKIEAAALDADGRFLSRRRRPNPGAYEAALAAVRDLVAEAEAEAGVPATVGVGAPGSVSPQTGVVRNANAVWLNGRPFRDDLEAALGRPVRLANDANCLALSEAVDGAGAGAKTVFAVVLGTGCGGGLVREGRLIEGANGLAGEWGHLPLPWAEPGESPGPQCWCGRRGCLETWVAGPALRRDHREASGRDLEPLQIADAARAGDLQAAAALARHASRLGRGLAMLCDIVDPDVFVFGGGLSNLAELYESLPDAIRPHVFADAWRARLAPARWGDSSGVRGAAWLWDADPAG